MSGKTSTREALSALFERHDRVAPFAKAITKARDWRARLGAIKAYYAAVERDILAAKPYEWAYDVYEVDWPMLFTPIESCLWCDIRSLGIPLYPQYPVTCERPDGTPAKTYFSDFANPIGKVVIECDGKTFHNDPKRDRDRDFDMRGSGWTVFRFTGSECRQDFSSETMQRSMVSRELERIAREYLTGEPRVRAVSRGFE